MDVRAALKGQYHAALNMLRQAIEQCPDELWNGSDYAIAFWRVAYHTLHATDLYLQPNEAAFRPWVHHREGYDDLPWPPPAQPACFPARLTVSTGAAGHEPPREEPPDSRPEIDEPYTKAQILDYLRLLESRLDADVDRLDLEAPESGFPWHKTIPKLEHQIHNIRHIQHHAAMLSGRLRLAVGPAADLRWMRTYGETYRP